MRTQLLILLLIIPLCGRTQLFEMPSPKAVSQNKFKSLELVSAADSTYKIIGSYKFDEKGRIIYEKTMHSPDVKPYYTVYTYDKKGRKATATDRYDDGRFSKRIEYTWLKDSIRIEAMYLNPKDSSELSVKYWIGPPPYNVARHVIVYNNDGKEKSTFGSIYNKKGECIGGYDSSAETHTMNEYYYFRYRQIRTYDSVGKLQNCITMRFDSAGYIISWTDSAIETKNVQHYEVTRSPTHGVVISKNNIPLTETERFEWPKKYEQIRLWDALLPPVLAPPPPICYPTTPEYDATGLIRRAVVNSICYPGIPGYPWTVIYRYDQ